MDSVTIWSHAYSMAKALQDMVFLKDVCPCSLIILSCSSFILLSM